MSPLPFLCWLKQASALLRYGGQMSALLILTALVGCSDDRKAPLQTNDPVYSSTIELFDHKAASGAELTKTFTLDDTITDGRLHINAFLWPDAALNTYTRIGTELDSIRQRLVDLEGQLLYLSLKQIKTHADSVAMDSLSVLKTATTAEEASRNVVHDSLDTRLDDRFKVSIWLDGDSVEMYPRAIFLDSAAVPGQIGGDTTVIWGQNFFTAPSLDSSGQRGRRMTLDLKRFFTADPSYRHSGKPARPAITTPDALPELYPITDWLSRLTPGRHTLHLRFGEAGVRSEVSVNLYVVYKNAG